MQTRTTANIRPAFVGATIYRHHCSVPLATLVSELRVVSAQLASIAAIGQDDAIAGPTKAAIETCTEVAKAWSGSWLGYQSRVYYADLAPPPPGARFSSEWGFMDMFSNPTRGDWREYTYDWLISEIERRAGSPNFTAAEQYRERATTDLEDGKATVISILIAALTIRDDPLVRDAIEEARGFEPLTQSNVININRPNGAMSRDPAAMDGGLTAPAHIAYLGSVIGLVNPGQMCGEVGTLARRLADHIDRVSGVDTSPTAEATGMRVFIGHGGSSVWRELKDFLHDRLHLDWEEFNRVSAAGLWTGDRLNTMLSNSSMAFLIFTAEDQHADGSNHARENVIHEAGLFQGRLGFPRAIVLLEDGCEEFSNIHGLGQIRFPRGNMAAKFEEIRGVLERERLIPRA
jgi:hypothetical protein